MHRMTCYLESFQIPGNLVQREVDVVKVIVEPFGNRIKSGRWPCGLWDIMSFTQTLRVTVRSNCVTEYLEMDSQMTQSWEEVELPNGFPDFCSSQCQWELAQNDQRKLTSTIGRADFAVSPRVQ